MCTVLIIPIKEENIENQTGKKIWFRKCLFKKAKNNAVEYGNAPF